jgi:predicted AAA+ superfamily ATPase
LFDEIKEDPKEWGRIVESAIGAHLVNSALTEGFKIYYWRERNDEVDFVLERRGKIIGLEVKSGGDQSNSGLNQFQKHFNPDKVLLIGKSGLSVQEFLTLNPVTLF